MIVGITETKSLQASSISNMLKNNSLLANGSATTTPDRFSEHKLRGLESIIETLGTGNSSDVVYSSDAIQENNNIVKCAQCQLIDEEMPLEIRPETLAVISEFETMTKELLSRRPSVNYEDS